jgi:hypothetical protein
MTNWANLTTVVVSVLQTILIIVTLIYTRHHFKLERAASYIARFNSEDMIRNRAVVENWLAEEIPDQEKLNRLTKDTELAIRVYTFINIFQELGVAYRSRMIHRASAEGYYSYLIISYWKRIRFMVEWRRTNDGRPTLYEDFQFLAETLARRAEKISSKGSIATNEAKIGSIKTNQSVTSKKKALVRVRKTHDQG